MAKYVYVINQANIRPNLKSEVLGRVSVPIDN